jgi:hypothetical protein
MFKGLSWGFAVVCGLSWFLGSTALAQIVAYDPAAYRDLVAADSPETIPPGSQITLSNWQQYRRFMPPGLQALYAGHYVLKVDTQPDFTITIGPTIPVGIPRQVVADTEKYNGQARLVKLSTGGYDLKNYTAGLPFPKIDPKDPDAGAKLLYDDHYYYYFEFLRNFHSYTFLIDRYQNIAEQEGDISYWRLMHLSDPGYPVDMPYAAGFLTSGRFQLVAPEQSKYTVEIQMTPDDAIRVPEIYVFLPSLRRSLRLSSAARCAPALGTDYVGDDSNGNIGSPGLFIPVYLGEHKMIGLVHADPVPLDSPSSYLIKSSVPGWPKPVVGKWEVRKVRTFALLPTPALGSSYCYGAKVVNLDADEWLPFWTDIYDSSRHLYKVQWNWTRPRLIQTGEMAVTAVASGVIMDVQNGHATVTVNPSEEYDRHARPALQEAQVVAFPASLSQVMR